MQNKLNQVLTNRVEVGARARSEQQTEALLPAKLFERLALVIGGIIHDKHRLFRLDDPSCHFAKELFERGGVVHVAHGPDEFALNVRNRALNRNAPASARSQSQKDRIALQHPGLLLAFVPSVAGGLVDEEINLNS